LGFEVGFAAELDAGLAAELVAGFPSGFDVGFPVEFEVGFAAELDLFVDVVGAVVCPITCNTVIKQITTVAIAKRFIAGLLLE
jgi:hypothetical protein